jgi:hypothetical protein
MTSEKAAMAAVILSDLRHRPLDYERTDER